VNTTTQSLNIAPATTLDYRRLAERRLPRFLFDYVDGGANDELTMAANTGDFACIKLRQNVLRDVDSISTATTLAGESVSMPLALAPVGMAGMMARRGEAQAVTCADRAGVPFTLSTVGICPLAEVAKAASKPFWFQLYMIRDRGVIRTLLDQAWEHGCRTLLFTVDLPMPGLRQRDFRNGLAGQLSLLGRLRFAQDIVSHPGWIIDVGLRGKPHIFGNLASVVPQATKLEAFKTWIDAQFDRSVTWRDIEWLREIWRGKLFIKGLLEATDAVEAARVGADGIVVSNHGGRQLDSVASSIASLPAVVEALAGKQRQIEVLLDGGVRSGLDVLKAVALGARGVLIGRPWVWALAARGAAGLDHLLSVFQAEMQVGMALAGVTRIEQLTPDLVDHSALRLNRQPRAA
jgi:L-lactate dehydrogenase (cytochrome)